MPQRHSKNNNDLAFFTYDEKRKLGYGTQKERLGKDSIKPFDACSLCLKPFVDPLCCRRGHVFCKECIYDCLLNQKRDIKRKLASYVAQQEQEKEEELEKDALKRQKMLDEFDQQNHGAVPYYSDKSLYEKDKNSFHGANSVKTTSYEEEALKTMKAFWLPSATPEAQMKAQAPSLDTVCPEGMEKLTLKSLFPISFTRDHHDKKSEALGVSYICPSCKDTLTNTHTLVVISTCGHVFCKNCVDKFIKSDKVCLECNKICKEKHLVPLEKGGTGFSAHDDRLQATAFKHVGTGTGMGLMKPNVKT